MIVYVGDIHGAWKTFKSLIDRYKLGNIEEITYLIQVGDFGIGFNNKSDLQTLEDLNIFFKERNIICIAIHGNHDDCSYFQGNHIYSNLMLVPDYTVMDIDDKKHLFVGGAVSIDRTWRLQKDQEAAAYGSSQRSYWFDELFVLDEEKLKDITGVEVVVTHTAPEWCYPDNRGGYGKFVEEWIPYDNSLTADLDAERIAMSKMFDILKQNGNWISSHLYGHFHSSSICMNGYCNHYLLDINEFRELY
jgi:DNA repair exonuclease SbcCD nuclease subunit